MLWLRRQNLTKASWTTSSASAADCTHCRAKSSNPGATSEKQLFQSSWLATLSMTFSRSLHSRRCQVQVLSTRAIFPDRGRNLARESSLSISRVGKVTPPFRSPMKSLRPLLLAFTFAISTLNTTPATPGSPGRATNVEVAPPPAQGKLYHGFYWGGVGTNNHDPTEHDVTPADVARYERAVGKRTAWIYFSDTGLSLEDFQPRRVTGSAISTKFSISG